MNDELLTKYLLGETSPEENTLIIQWLEKSEENKKKFAQFQLIWETSKHLAIESTVDAQEAWQRFKQRRVSQETQEAVIRPISSVRSSNYNWLQAAAVFLLVSFGAWATYYLLNRQNQQSYALITLKTGREVRTDTLPDGSVITLNRNSQISYPDAFSGNLREINLQQGEAFFNVTPDKFRPFVVKVNEVTVRVVGTSFNIKARPEATEVIVETGKVQVSKKEKTLALTPREMVVVRTSENRLIKEKTPDQLYAYYRSATFKADNTPLWRLVEVMNEFYGARITLERKELRHLPITSTFNFRNQSLADNLQIISLTHGLKVSKQGNQIILK